MKSIGVLLLCLLGCSGKGEDGPAPKGAGEPRRGAPGAGEAADAAVKASVQPSATIDWPEPVWRQLSAADKKRMRAAMRKGSKLQEEKKWEGAVAAYEEAIRIDPVEPRAYSELSWVAFQAGQLAKARLAADRSVALAIDSRIKAASLYNLGRVEEAEGKKARAIEAYLESLRLRPNPTVKKRLTDLGGTVASLLSPTPPCAKPASEKELCACMEEALVPSGTFECSRKGKSAGSLSTWELRDDEDAWGTESYLVVATTPAGLLPVALIASELYTGRGQSTGFTMESMKIEELGGKQVVRVVHRIDSDSDSFDSMTNVKERWLTVCVLGDAPRCPARIPLELEVHTEYMTFEDAEDGFKVARSSGSVEKLHQRTDVKVGADGKLTVILVEGKKTDDLDLYLGSHVLW